MDTKKLLGILFFSIFIFSTVNAVTVTDPTTGNTPVETQSLAQLSAQIATMNAQIKTLNDTIKANEANTFMKSDLQNLYDNMVNINHQAEMSIITDNLIIVLLAFAVFFLLIGKGMVPQREKTPKKEKVKPDASKL